MTMRIAALVAAAGLSSRMQRFKPLLPYGETTIIEHILRKFRDLGADPLMVITGHLHSLLAPVAEESGAVVVHNPAYADTDMFYSLKLGLAHLEGECDAFFVQPCDIPQVSVATLRSQLRTLRDRNCLAVRPTLEGKRGGHPLLFAAAAIPPLLAYAGGDGLRGAMASLPGTVVNISVSDPGILLDADSPEDYQALLDRLAKQKSPDASGSS